LPGEIIDLILVQLLHLYVERAPHQHDFLQFWREKILFFIKLNRACWRLAQQVLLPLCKNGTFQDAVFTSSTSFKLSVAQYVLHARAGGGFKFDLDINNEPNSDPNDTLNGWIKLARKFADVMAIMQIRDLPDAVACGWQRGFPAVTFSNTQCGLNQVLLARIRRERIWQLFVDMYPTGITFEDEPEPFTYLPPSNALLLRNQKTRASQLRRLYRARIAYCTTLLRKINVE
jgi:hypothetical protein